MSVLKIAKNPYVRLLINLAYAIGNCAIGFSSHSWWFMTVGAYYSVLSATRFSVLRIGRKAGGDVGIELFSRRITGVLLVIMSICIVGVNILSAIQERGKAFHEIIMITIATYTFTKITIAIVGMVKAKHSPSPVHKTLRNISLADACVSIYSMQRSMLVSFPGMAARDIQILNIFTGTAVWIVLLLLGINLIGGKKVDMAKSKIEAAVVGGYQKIEDGVVAGYKKIEKGVVGGYTKLEDVFVKTYLAKEGETVEEAKERLKKAHK